MRFAKLLFALALFLPASAWAQTGKIAGQITEASTGESLPGVNVSITGTTQGAITDADGYYFIVNVRPGSYDLRASFIGFAAEVHEGIRVNIGLTTEIDFVLQEEAVGLDEVIVTDVRPVVQRDVSASVANITAEEIENLPVTDIERVIGLQAGFERGLTVRGFGGDQIQFMVDGLSMASGRDNTPYTGVSYTSVQEVQVQTGGFNAEYGNVRSGLVNVVTKEPERNQYFVDAIVRYSPTSQKNFPGVDVEGNDVDMLSSETSFYIRPLVDPAVAFAGTGAWPSWMQSEYYTFAGWDAIAEGYNGREKTSFTGQQMQSVFFDHYLRNDISVSAPDYEIDATIGGPVPGLSNLLGDLRFTASFRQTQTAYSFGGHARDAFQERTGQAKLISNFSPGMKLTLSGLYGQQMGLNRNESGWPDLTTGDKLYYPWQSGGLHQSMYGWQDNEEIDQFGGYFSPMLYNLMDVDRVMLGAQFTHALNANTFYDVQLQNITTDYHTRTIEPRNLEATYSYLNGGIMLNEEPYGFSIKDQFDKVLGIRTSGHWGSGYDNSSVNRFTGRFDVTSQRNRFLLGKAGVEYIYSNYDTDFGENDPEHPHHTNPKRLWNRKPQQAATYAQSKLEFRGMVANVGVRLDYFHAGGDWYTYDTYERTFSAAIGRARIDELLEQEPTQRQLALSPRIGISFPVTDDSKLYFNYGHFRNALNPMRLFNIEEGSAGALVNIGNPDHPMPRTVAYELGFDQSLFNQYLLRLAGYYRDLGNQPRSVRYISLDDLVSYSTALPWNYGDVRGFEVTISRNRGQWIRGFLNYTYMVRKTGNFGFSRFDENRTAQQNFVTTTQEHYTSKPIPEPFARFNLEFLFPQEIGPQVGGSYPLGDWRINFLGEWRQGVSMTWDGLNLTGATGSGPRELQGNVRWKDYYTLDMRFSKSFNTSLGSAQLFVDMTNVLNIRHLYFAGGALFGAGDQDLSRYMGSLHLPEDTLPRPDDTPATGLYGDDRPGDFRKPGVAYVPIVEGQLPEAGEGGPLYYVAGENKYYEWSGGSFAAADQGKVDQVLEDKAYINMPNRMSSQFLNPRNVFFGLRISF